MTQRKGIYPQIVEAGTVDIKTTGKFDIDAFVSMIDTLEKSKGPRKIQVPLAWETLKFYSPWWKAGHRNIEFYSHNPEVFKHIEDWHKKNPNPTEEQIMEDSPNIVEYIANMI